MSDRLNRQLLVLLPLGLLAWNYVLVPFAVSPATLFASLIGAALVVAGASRRRALWLQGGAFALLVGHALAHVASGAAPQPWLGLLYGVALLLLLEAGYDHVTLFRTPAARGARVARVRHLLRVLAGVAVAGALVAMFGVSFAPRLLSLSPATIFWVGGAAIIVLSVAAAAMLRFWFRTDLSGS